MGSALEDHKLNSIVRELGIITHLIGSGLTTIRKADFVQHGKFGSSFFELTLGIERICKIIIIRKFQRTNNGEFPTNKYIRNFSHSITDLISEVFNGYESKFIGNDEIIDEMISFFSEFAKTIRYYNLDSITKDVDSKNDPMKLWAIIQDKIVKRHYKKKDFTEFEKKIITGLDIHSTFMFHDMEGNLINNASDFYEKGKTLETIQSYSVYYIHQIIVDIVRIINEEEQKYYVYPVMTEFFPYYHETSFKKQQILKKKKWFYPN